MILYHRCFWLVHYFSRCQYLLHQDGKTQQKAMLIPRNLLYAATLVWLGCFLGWYFHIPPIHLNCTIDLPVSWKYPSPVFPCWQNWCALDDTFTTRAPFRFSLGDNPAVKMNAPKWLDWNVVSNPSWSFLSFYWVFLHCSYVHQFLFLKARCYMSLGKRPCII